MRLMRLPWHVEGVGEVDHRIEHAGLDRADVDELLIEAEE
jgi:hypothetical protein